MCKKNKSERYSTLLSILIWGAMWGIFEATVGYVLHAVSFGYSWLIWYPAACFFMANVYRKTRKVSSICLIGLLCASIKLLNLLLPGSIDRVINPAISILFESLAMAAIVFAATRLLKGTQKNPFIKALIAFSINTGWRLLFILYLAVLVPDWMREISVISAAGKFIPFFITQNLITSAIIYLGYQLQSPVFHRLEIVERRIANWQRFVPLHAVPALKTGFAAFLLCANVVLQLTLR